MHVDIEKSGSEFDLRSISYCSKRFEEASTVKPFALRNLSKVIQKLLVTSNDPRLHFESLSAKKNLKIGGYSLLKLSCYVR